MFDSNPTIDVNEYLVVNPNRNEIARFMSKVKINRKTGCWEWQASCRGAYGQLRYRGRSEKAHRWFCAWIHGPIPKGRGAEILQVDHLCRNTICVNPAHLELVTPRVNTLRSSNPSAQRRLSAECAKGHLFTQENTHWNRRGGRECKICTKEKNARARSTPEGLEKRRAACRASYYKRRDRGGAPLRPQPTIDRREI